MTEAITHTEITRLVDWQLFHGTEPRPATFVVIRDGAEKLVVRLVRIQGEAVSFGRKDALMFGQPVAQWEAEAMNGVAA